MLIIIVLFHNYFSLAVSTRTTYISFIRQNNQLPVVQQYFTNIAAL